MAARNISLTAEQDAFGRQEDALKLEGLRAQIRAGVDALDRGDFVQVDDADLDSFLERLVSSAAGDERDC
jgi:hypothetical protein